MTYRQSELRAAGLLAEARRIRLVAHATPTNFRKELRRLIQSWERGDITEPRFEYTPSPSLEKVRAALSAALKEVDGPLTELYRRRVEELIVESWAAEAVGKPDLWKLARHRFPRRDRFDDEADVLAERWVGAHVGESELPDILSDDERDERSLLCAMRRAVGKHKLPVRVRASVEMAPLAATGDGVIFVAAGRMLTGADVSRTVIHEVMGHVLPQQAAKETPMVLFALGTAFGADDQEGRAILMEERAEELSFWRRRELALRHLAARRLESGAGFVDAAKLLLQKDVDLTDALRVTARVYRGGGLGREAGYLPAFLRVRDALAKLPELELAMERGRISVEAAGEILTSGVLQDCSPPRWR
ncbi:MAG: DUF1704 domain-containing protein [Polyangiaceae bacterium]|nr:DUF1704 domain-containing protein [Polyangiaceae bacterium]